MPQIKSTGLPRFHYLIYHFSTLKNHSTLQVLLTNGKQFHRFYEIVAEPVVKRFLYRQQFFCRFLREAVCQILAHQFLPVTNQILYYKKNAVGNDVMYPQRQQ